MRLPVNPLAVYLFRKGDVNVKTAITERRKLSADLLVTRGHMGLKNREGDLTDHLYRFPHMAIEYEIKCDHVFRDQTTPRHEK